MCCPGRLGNPGNPKSLRLWRNWEALTEGEVVRNPSEIGRAGIGPEGQRLLFGLVRLLRPVAVLETGTHAGVSTATMARALSANAQGGLVHSLDFYSEVGSQIPETLISQVRLTTPPVCGKRKVLTTLLASQQVDLFAHDSNHSYGNTKFQL